MTNERNQTICYRYDLKVSHFKSELYSWLDQEREPDQPELEGFCHFPDGYYYEFYKQLTAEERIKYAKKENPFIHSWTWEKTRERNEALDCRVYGRGAASMLGLDR